MLCACRGIPNFQDTRGTITSHAVDASRDGAEPIAASGQACWLYVRVRDLDTMLPQTGARLHVQQMMCLYRNGRRPQSHGSVQGERHCTVACANINIRNMRCSNAEHFFATL